jgi:penicillin amidase
MTRILLALLLSIAPALAQERQVQGLTAPVEIITDRWGIPHINAESQEDAFFGQGYAAATARLWQLDVTRRRQLGRLAEAFGPDFLPFDEASRHVVFRGDVAAEWPRQSPRAHALAQAWVAGINARVAEVLADPALLPPEFLAMDARPEPWHVDDLIRMRWGAGPNIRNEMRRALLACQGLLGLDALAQPLEPPGQPQPPMGLDPCRLKREQLALYDRLLAPLPWPQARQRSDVEQDDLDARAGSNAWVIAPGRSPSGRALLANDPHLAVGAPGPRFITHLRAPGLDAIGAGPVFRPGFQFGHNDRIAHGRTDLQIDQEDLYLLEINAEGTAFRGPAGMEPVTRLSEAIAVRGQAPVIREFAHTRLGPVIFEDRAGGHALALRSAFLEPGPVVTLEYLAVIMARNWQEYREALRFAVWGSNYMYADIDGHIGWQTGGRAPLRLGHDGLMPVPAAGGFDWAGYMPLEQMVGLYDPPEGWIATANQMPYPQGWPEARMTSREWIPNDRYRRVAAVLAGQSRHGMDEAAALQLDTVSLRAQALVALLDNVPELPAEAALLRGWDGRLSAESEAASLYQMWWAELAAALRLAVVPEAARGAIAALHPHVVLSLAGRAEHRDLVAQALQRAAARLRALPEDGRAWGARHRVDLRHAMSAMVPNANVLGGQSGGDGATVMARWWANGQNPVVTGGASFRAVLDIGAWDAGRGINLPGQSGDPREAHYRDLYPLWVAGEMVPLAYSAAAVAAVAESRVRLVPR